MWNRWADGSVTNQAEQPSGGQGFVSSSKEHGLRLGFASPEFTSKSGTNQPDYFLV